MNKKLDLAGWGTIALVALSIVGGAVSFGILYEWQQETAKTLAAFSIDVKHLLELQDVRVNKLDDRVRGVEIAAGRVK